MQHVVFKEGEQRLFLQEVKTRSGKTWKELACNIGKTTRMMFFYLHEQNRMPFHSFKILARFSNRVYDYSLININNSPTLCHLPKKLSEPLAEFLGVLAGDGYLGRTPYTISVVLVDSLIVNMLLT